MIEKLKTLESDIGRYSDVKRNMEKDIDARDSRITELSLKIKSLETEQKLTLKRVFKCRFELNNCANSEYYDKLKIEPGSLLDQQIKEL